MVSPSSSTDPEAIYRSLKADYAFNQEALRQQFLDVNGDLILSITSLAKQSTLLRFRLSQPPKLTHQKTLFLVDISSVPTRDNYCLSGVLGWTDAPASHDLSTEIKKVYPTVPWAIDYFVFSTFPSIFAHFFSDEYLAGGHRFIVSHIEDPLVPRLIGTYFLHAFVFRDRLLSTFFDTIVDFGGTPSPEDLVGLFVDAFAVAVSYLTPWHVSV
jgi:hypothetical protein